MMERNLPERMPQKSLNQVLIEMYPYSYIYKGERTILIWQTGEDSNDTFKLNAEKKLVASNSEKSLKEILGAESEIVQWSDSGEINFDTFWTSLKNLRINRASSSKTCSLLLDGWNFIEDLLRTFDFNDKIESLRTPLLDKVNDKLFYGNNLPAITPEGKSYSPLWTQEEIQNLRKVFKSIWEFLRAQGCIFP